MVIEIKIHNSGAHFTTLNIISLISNCDNEMHLNIVLRLLCHLYKPNNQAKCHANY